MWASCCGLLNEVMGTGTVRAQQPGFGAGAGPFRFAPSAGYSTYPPATSGSAGQLCKACGLAFSVFRRKVIRSCVSEMLVWHDVLLNLKAKNVTSKDNVTGFYMYSSYTLNLITISQCICSEWLPAAWFQLMSVLQKINLQRRGTYWVIPHSPHLVSFFDRIM